MFDVFTRLSPAPYMKQQEDGSTRHLTDITADKAILYLRSIDSGPFALTLSFNAPHADDGDERQFIWPASVDSLYSDFVVPRPPLSDAAFYDALPEFLRDASLKASMFVARFPTCADMGARLPYIMRPSKKLPPACWSLRSPKESTDLYL